MASLTPRQRQVLSLVTLTNREIGARLGIKYRTVHNHLHDIFVRLDVASDIPDWKRTQALLLALRLGLVALDEVELPPPAGWCWERLEQMRAAGRRE